MARLLVFSAAFVIAASKATVSVAQTVPNSTTGTTASTSLTTANESSATTTAVPLAQSQCETPITFICSNDPGNGLTGPHRAEKGGRNREEGDNTGVRGGGGGDVLSVVSNSVWDAFGAVSSWILGPSAADGAAKAVGGRATPLGSASGSDDRKADKRLSFYEAADAGSECYALSGELSATTAATLPDPNTMTTSQREASYIHVLCGDVSGFHNRAETYVTDKLRSLKMGRNFTEDGVAPILLDINASLGNSKNITAESMGFFPARLPSAKAFEEAGKKLRNTALIIVPGGSYEKLSFQESMIFPMEVLYQQVREELQSEKEEELKKKKESNENNKLPSASAATASSGSKNDFLPIVLQYRLTPPTPEAPIEDISKVVRMLERYRQKRLATSLSLPADDSDSQSEDDTSGNKKKGDVAEEAGADDMLNGGGEEGADDLSYEIGLSKEERRLLLLEREEREESGRRSAALSSKRLSPAMLGLTDDFKIVIAGFSAGGHAAASYAAMAKTIPSITATVLVYPVVTMENATIAHYRSTVNLLNVEPNATAVSLLPEAMIPYAQASDEEKANNNSAENKAATLPMPPAPVAGKNNANIETSATDPDDGFATVDSVEGNDDQEPTTSRPSDNLSEAQRKRESVMAAANDRLEFQRGLQHRFSPNNYPSNFPTCVYIAHTKTDPTVSVDHSHLLFSSLVRHRRAAEARKQSLAKMQRRRKQHRTPSGTAEGQEKRVAEKRKGFNAADETSIVNVSSTNASNNGGEQPFAPQVQVVRFTDPANPTRTTGELSYAYGVGLRVYPYGPHGRWNLNGQSLPELTQWWSEAKAFLENNGC